jgi:hypothetical protein
VYFKTGRCFFPRGALETPFLLASDVKSTSILQTRESGASSGRARQSFASSLIAPVIGSINQ